MVEIGKYNFLRIAGKNANGLSLTDGQTEVLLPYTEVPKNQDLEGEIEVFVYINKAGDKIGTIKDVYAVADEFSFLDVVDTNDDGAFLDIGIAKDVFAPNKLQKRPMQKGQGYVVYIFVDKETGKLLASSQLDNYVEHENHDFEEGDEVKILIADKTPLGYNAIINNKFIGLIYENEIFGAIETGEFRKGWIKNIRVEGKIDLSLQPQGFGHILDTKEVVLLALKENKGVIALGDKSSPDEIYERFQISKSAFKKAIGGLYKERLITLSDGEIKLL